MTYIVWRLIYAPALNDLSSSVVLQSFRYSLVLLVMNKDYYSAIVLDRSTHPYPCRDPQVFSTISDLSQAKWAQYMALCYEIHRSRVIEIVRIWLVERPDFPTLQVPLAPRV